MDAYEKVEKQIDRLVSWYGDGGNDSSPTRSQWRHIVERPADNAVTLLNFFKLRDQATYAEEIAGVEYSGTGQDAFDRYAAVSIPTLEKVGGKFLLVSPFEEMFVGEAEDWDLIAIGAYPNSKALLAMFEDASYRAVFPHRTAACERQKVVVCSG